MPREAKGEVCRTEGGEREGPCREDQDEVEKLISYDKGDIECLNPFVDQLPYPNITFEAKHRANLNVHQTLAKSKEKADGDVVLAWKKTKRKGNSKVRVADGERVVYIVDEELMFRLLEDYKGSFKSDQKETF